MQAAPAALQELRQPVAATASAPTTPPGGATEPTPTGEPAPSPQQQAATLRHAADRLERVAQAVKRRPALEAPIKPGEKKAAQVSTTDPQATVMRRADGGFRPAYNVEYGTACAGQVVVGVDVVTGGRDQGQLPPRLDALDDRFQQRPKEVLVDGGFAKLADIAKVPAGGPCQVDAPVAKPKKATVERQEPKATDRAEVAEWRQRLGTTTAQKIDNARAATAECVNA